MTTQLVDPNDTKCQLSCCEWLKQFMELQSDQIILFVADLNWEHVQIL